MRCAQRQCGAARSCRGGVLAPASASATIAALQRAAVTGPVVLAPVYCMAAEAGQLQLGGLQREVRWMCAVRACRTCCHERVGGRGVRVHEPQAGVLDVGD